MPSILMVIKISDKTLNILAVFFAEPIRTSDSKLKKIDRKRKGHRVWN